MEKVLKFLRKNKGTLSLLAKNVLLCLFLITVLHFSNTVDITFFFRLRFLAIAILFFTSLLLFLLFEKKSSAIKKTAKKIFKQIFPPVLVLQLLTSFSSADEFEMLRNLVFGIFLFSLLGFLWAGGSSSEKEKDLSQKKSIILLLIIIALFTFIKAPYFDKPFTGEHAMKYNAYVEPAKYMYEKNDPFWSQRKYLADPPENTQGVASTFGSIPITEWGLLIVYNVFSDNPIETNTRLFTHSLGILILISAFLFFTKWLTKKQSLTIIFLISINPIFNFTTFVTVEDSWLILFTFLSLNSISKYFQKDDITQLFYSGLFLGLGNINKESIFLWLFPILFVLLAFKSKSLAKFLRDISILALVSLLPIVVFNTSLKFLPSEIILSLSKFLIWVLLFKILHGFLKKYKENLLCLFENLVQKKTMLLVLTVPLLVAAYFFLKIADIERLTSNFLTDSQLIFNWDMYFYMLNVQFKNYITPNVFFLSMVGLFACFVFAKKEQKIILTSFLTGSLVFWILASKSIFFHNYYTNIIMITLVIAVGFLTFLVLERTKSEVLKILIALCFFMIVFPNSKEVNTTRLENESLSQYLPVAEFLKENMDNGVFVRPGTVHNASSILALYSGKSSIFSEKLVGLKDRSLKEYDVEFVLKNENESFYFLNKIINAQTQEDVSETIDRGEIIRGMLFEETGEEKEKKSINIIYLIENQLEFVKTIGGTEIYRVKK